MHSAGRATVPQIAKPEDTVEHTTVVTSAFAAQPTWFGLAAGLVPIENDPQPTRSVKRVRDLMSFRQLDVDTRTISVRVAVRPSRSRQHVQRPFSERRVGLEQSYDFLQRRQ